MVGDVKKAAPAKPPAPSRSTVVDGASALKEITQMLGLPPEFLSGSPRRRAPVPGREFRDVQLNPGRRWPARTRS